MFNHAPVIATTQFFSTATNGQVAENVGVGTSLFILIAYDPDGDTKGYALVDDYGLFSIDGNGIVSLTGALDYETTPSYVLRVSVSDGTDSVFEDITLTISDANEAPVFTQNHYFASVAENDATAAVETVSASIDAGETIAYSIVAGGSGVFAIDENSGAITLKRALDFENEPTAYTLTINAYDGHYHTTAQVTVNVTDVNDNAPVLTALQTTAVLVEQTAAAPIDTGITFMASDVDTNTSFSESDFAVSDAVTGAVDPRFAIVADGNHWKLQLKAGATLDYENADDQSIALMVKVNDGIYSDEAEVTITVTDINDVAPMLTAIQATASLAEQTAATPTDTGITFTASDVDTNTSFSATDFAVSDDRFQVVADGTNWKLQLKAGKTLNYEDANDRSIILNVKVNDGIHDSDDVAVTVNVTDANDAPVFNEYALQWFATFAADGNVAEDIAIDTPIAVIWASDDDGNSLTYRLLDGASAHLFKINESTGIISVKAALDYETAISHTLTIEASDGSATTTTDITIDVVNINDTAPVLDTNRTAVSLTEQTAATAVDTGIILTPSDPDGLHTFSDEDFTLSGDGRFEIVADGSNWKLQLKTGATLDHENAGDRTIDLNIKVNDGIYDSNDVAITINVVDVNDNTPILTANQTTASLAEQTTTAAVDTGITFTVSDADASSTFSAASFEISGDNRFEVVADGDDWKLQLKADKTLDYEDADDRTIALNVKVNDGNHDSNEIAVTISVSDVNDTAPILTASQTTASLAEQTAATAVDTGITFTASDVDTNTSFAETDFTISGDDRFEVVADGNDWKLQLKADATLDHENADDRVIALTIKVNDGKHDSNNIAVTINVSDVNDNAPVLVAIQTTASLAEQTTTVAVDTGITFTVSDADVTSTFLATDFTVSGDDRFEIVADGNNWKLQLKTGATLNYETPADRTIALKVKVNDDTHDSNEVAVTVNVTDANDAPVFDAYAPQWFGTFASGNVAEDTVTNTPIAVIWASDEDGDSITYRLVPNASSHLFKIDENVGIISVKEPIDYETTTNHTLTIEASDNKGGTTTTDVTINVADVNDNAPSINGGYSRGGGRVEELTTTRSVWTGLGFVPYDEDAGTTFTADSFTIIGADGNVDDRFEIRAGGYYWYLYLKTGETLDYDNPAHRFIDLTVMVSDGVNVSSSPLSNVTVKTVRRIDGTEGSNVIEGNSDFENIYGYGGADTIYAGAGVDWIYGGSGNDIIYGGAGDEWIFGENNDDTIYGGAGDDRVIGGAHDDTIYGGAGDDRIFGEENNDTLYGGAGNEWMRGGSGEDTFYGGTGVDFFLGEEGNDLFYLDIANAVEGNVNSDVATDFSRGGTNGIDRILIEVSRTDKTTIDGLTTDQAKLNKLMELADIRSEKAHEHIRHEGSSTIYTDDLNVKDTVIYDKRGTSRTDDDIILMVLTDFNDDLTFDMFHVVLEDIISGKSGSQTLSGTGRNSVIDGGSGNDTIYGGAGDDIIRGGSERDTLYGGEDNDLLYGGSNNDILHGEGGVDILYGNFGRDWFVLDIVNAGAPDVDIVADFWRSDGSHNYDVIRVDTVDGDETSFTALGLRVEQVANKVITGHETGENDASKMDTVIYKIVGQADSTSNGETDDFALMIIEDYTITDADFATMVEVI